MGSKAERWDEMERQTSDFSVSAYLEFGSQEDEAIFDMAAPLVTSASSSAATPANTPCLRKETLQRTSRVVRKKSYDDDTPRPDSRSISSFQSTPTSPLRDSKLASLYQLDSHIISALEALQGDSDSPALDLALGLTDEHTRCVSPEVEAGLGLGMHLRSDSIYGLSTVSSLPIGQRPASTWFDDEDEILQITDLDTGVVRDIRMGDIEA